MKKILCLTLCLTLPAMAEPSSQKVVTLPEAIHSKTKNLHKDFLVYTPKDYSPEKKSPLLIFLHGSGERGKNINLAKKHGPPKLVEQGKDLEFIVVTPQCTRSGEGRSWWLTEDLTTLLDYVKKNYAVDNSRIYLTGLSMGGFGTWTWAAEHPETFAAVVPICGGGDPAKAKAYGELPIWAFHGDKDNAVPLRKSQEMVDAMNAVKGNVKLTVYPGVGHDSWTETYNNPEVFKWLLSHRK